MGMLVNGKWVKGSIVKSDKKGGYDRQPRTFREFISDQHPICKPETDRYHLYVSYACPWATRTLIYRNLKGLVDHITVSAVHPDMLEEGWVFDDSYPGATRDDLFDFKTLKEVYQKADPNVTTSVSVPVLWDKKTSSMVNNESSEIIRMFNVSFNQLTGNTNDYYPDAKRAEIDALNEKIYAAINNGVYRAGFARTQDAYDAAVTQLFSALDELDALLENRNYLVGDDITEADIRLIPTLLRFDLVYVTHFKCNVRRIKDYKNLSRYTEALYEIPAIKDATNFDHIKRHYYYSHEGINPFRIIPKGPGDIF
jgi:glutathionyl-hydroquinone reductase